MPEAFITNRWDLRLVTLDNSISSGEVWEMGDGMAAFYPEDEAKSSGDQVHVQVAGEITVPKTSGVVFLDGQRVYWDHSANKTIAVPTSDRDFYLGTAKDDWASTTIQMVVNLNRHPRYRIDLARDTFLHVPVASSGSPYMRAVGGGHKMVFDTTTEAQKLDLLSLDSFDVDSNWIAELEFMFVDDGDDAAIDFNIGVANATHATDADSITESCFIHTDGNAVSLYAESDDDDAGEVAATDTTVDYTLSTPVRVMMDGRDPSDIQIYVNESLVLSGSVFTLSAASGPLKLLAHVEKSSNDTPLDLYINRMTVRTMEQ